LEETNHPIRNVAEGREDDGDYHQREHERKRQKETCPRHRRRFFKRRQMKFHGLNLQSFAGVSMRADVPVKPGSVQE
jgi:hypothetical protein